MESIWHLYPVPILRIRKLRLRESQIVIPRSSQPGVGNLAFWPWPADSSIGPPLSHAMDGFLLTRNKSFSLLWPLLGSTELQCHPSPMGQSIYHIHNDFTSSITVNRNHSLKFNLVNFHLCKQLIQWRRSQPVSSYTSDFHAAGPSFCREGLRVLGHFKPTSLHYYVRESDVGVISY